MVRLLQRRQPGQDHVGVPGGLVDPVVDADHAVQVGRHLVELVAAGVDSTGLPATVISARIWPSPGVAISSARHDTGTWPSTSGAPRTRVPPAELGAPPSSPGIGCTVTDHAAARGNMAAGDVEVAGEDVDDVDEPAGQRAELLVAQPMRP